MLYKARKYTINLFDDYSKIASEGKHASFQEERIKILAPKQILQRLPVALAQVKTGNTSENSLYTKLTYTGNTSVN